MFGHRMKLLLTACLSLGMLSAAPTALAKTYKIATIAPDGTRWMQEMRTGAKEIEKSTDGRVKFKFYPGGVMGNDQAVYRKMRAGQLHGGAVTSSSLGDIYPDAAILSLPMLFRSYEEVDYVRERFDDTFARGLEAAGLVPVGFSEGGFTYLMSQEDITSFADLQGKKVWVPENDPINESMVKRAGVTPVPLPFPDVYTGLQTGLIDTVAAIPTAAIAFQWHTKLDSLLNVPLTYIMGVLVIDAKSFGKMDEQDQATVRRIMGETFERLNAINRADNIKAKEALANQNIKFNQLPPKGVNELKRIADEAIAEHDSGELYTPELLAKIRGYLKEFRNE